VNVVDLFSGAGGAARGYVLAGHNVVVGVDSNPALEADYLKSGADAFKCMDALEAITALPSADFYHASPPCQHYSGMTNCRPGRAEQYPDLIGPVREALIATGKPFVIENVEKARAWLRNPVTLCSFAFGRPMYRHRLFEVGGGFSLPEPPRPPDDIRPLAAAACELLGFDCPDKLSLRCNRDCGWPHPVPAAKAGHWEPGRFVSPSGNEYKRPSELAFDIDWMSRRADRAEAIPPCFTEWIGAQIWTMAVPDRPRRRTVAGVRPRRRTVAGTRSRAEVTT
jgi:DNA (cytosine-5)-methyltransferase 1